MDNNNEACTSGYIHVLKKVNKFACNARKSIDLVFDECLGCLVKLKKGSRQNLFWSLTKISLIHCVRACIYLVINNNKQFV